MTAPVQDAIVLFGDSITQMGWMEGGICQRLADDYVRKLDVVNRGLSGYTTEWALPVFKQILPTPEAVASGHAQRTRLLTIWFGGNDSVLPGFRQHIPLPTYSENLRTLVRLARERAPGVDVMLITPPPVYVAQRREMLLASMPPGEVLGDDNRNFGVTAQYAEAVRAVAREEDVVLVDAWQAMWDAAGREEAALRMLLSDGLHLTAKGYTVVYEEIIKTIKTKLPNLHYNNLQEVFAKHDQIDLNNLEASVRKRSAEKNNAVLPAGL